MLRMVVVAISLLGNGQAIYMPSPGGTAEAEAAFESLDPPKAVPNAPHYIGTTPADGQKVRQVVRRGMQSTVDDSIFANEFSIEFDNSDQIVPASVEKALVRTDIEGVHRVLANEMADLSPEVHGKIASSIRSHEVDRSKYRDIFLIKKRVVSDGERRLITFDIKERIIPRVGGYSMSRDVFTNFLLSFLFVLLICLVLATTLRMYRIVVSQQLDMQLKPAHSEKK